MKLAIRFLSCLFLLGTLSFAGDGQEKVTALALLKKATAAVKADKAAALKEISDAKGPYVEGEIYVFAYDLTGTMLAHPKNPKLIGKNLIETPDVDGKLFRKEIVEGAKAKGTGTVDYRYKNPGSGKIEDKTTHYVKARDVILACGIYK
jgi:cytochrome c